VPSKFAKDAIIEAITEGIPLQDSAYARAYNLDQGPGLVAKSGTLPYQMMFELSDFASPHRSAAAATR
jgi:succinyl-CoA synthetase alpha subunit